MILEQDIQEFEKWYVPKFKNLLKEDIFGKIIHHNGMLEAWLASRRLLREKEE